MTTKNTLARKLTESGIMLALATILSLLKAVELPYGGSITVASMLPIMLIAYRYGTPWGLLTGFVHSLIQFLLGSSVLHYATSWVAGVAIVLLDYTLAFTVVGLAGVFRKKFKNPTAMALGALCTCLLRYLMHVISGCTVWAGLSIPTQDALVYSLIYNATYMLPETIVTVVAAIYVTSVLDFASEKLSAVKREGVSKESRVMGIVAGLAVTIGVIVIAILVFAKLQNGETGEFDITGIQNVNKVAVIVTACVSAVVAVVALIARKVLASKK